MAISYFVCTLGQAALPSINTPFRDVNHLIDEQAADHPDLPAVGFYTQNDTSDVYETRILTFREVRQGVLAIADAISKSISVLDGETVGLLCSSSPAFLFTWLGLIRLGHPVLLVAPQCSPSAISHLTKACDTKLLFYDTPHKRLAEDAAKFSSEEGSSKLSIENLLFEDDLEVFKLVNKEVDKNTSGPTVSASDIAYLHHTSGTSSGIPKPIPQTHKGGVGVLPALDGTAAATFTTTPLYHGGVADLFRAWASSALIYLFPGHHAPITANNVVKCLMASNSATEDEHTPPVRYFSSVPYVLQLMAELEDGLKLLQKMDMVGVGGSALPPEAGDSLVRNNVNLVSRYGSAECGFLMSSHRDYEKDKEWQYLRQSEEVEKLKFEKQDDGLSELVILSGWPHMAKTNRDDGSFATADLFAPHPSIHNAWRYHSRADSQLALITGKKFDPSPLEGSLSASSPLISDVLIFGNGKPYPGALLFRSEAGKNESDSKLISQIAPVVEKLNRESQSHAQIPRNMLIPMPFEIGPLEKSSKGTILRGIAEDKFREQIEAFYNNVTFAYTDVRDEDVPRAISEIIEQIVGNASRDGETLTDDTDLFAYGVDSVACIQARHALQQLLPKDAKPLPLSIVEDSSTISKLSEIIVRYRHGKTAKIEDQGEILPQMVEQYSNFNNSQTPSRTAHRTCNNILLTGTTGLLGAHILSQLLTNKQVDKIFLLIRGATPLAAKERVLKSLSSRMLPTPTDFDKKIQVLPCKLSDPALGLSSQNYSLLTEKVDSIFHLAWSVNFLISLRSLASTHLAGLQNLLNLALACKRNPSFLFCSSVASVSSLTGKTRVPEHIVEDISACGSTGYSQSKLAAELICQRCATTTSMRGRITVLRVGQLSGDTEHGVWNSSEAYPLMLASSKTTKVLPDLKDIMSWLPVDVAARAYIEAAFNEESTSPSTLPNQDGDRGHAVRVLHLLNPCRSTTFSDLTHHLKDAGADFDIVSPATWLDKLSALRDDERTGDHPALRLLPFWQATYGDQKPAVSSVRVDDGRNRYVNGVDDVDAGGEEYEYEYEMTLSRHIMPSLNEAIGPLNSDYLLKLWRWIEGCVG